MTTADQYRVKAAELGAKARQQADPALKAQLEAMSLGYVRLAQQADQNARTDIVYETGLEHPGAQQQQQIQPKPKEDDS